MISIIIPIFNQLFFTKECLIHIEKYTDIPYEVIIIDNGSSDGTNEYIQAQSVQVISNRENKGVYAAWNQGILRCKSDQIIIMNNDILVTPHWAAALLQFSQKEPNRVIGPAMREGSLNYPLFDYSRQFTKACRKAWRKNELCNFSLVLFNRRFFDQVGLFDERFFVTRGDDDMTLRLKEKNIELAVTGSAFVHHYSEKTQKDLSSVSNIHAIREKDNTLFFEKWGIPRKTFIEKNVQKIHNYWIPFYEKIRFGYSLKTPKPKIERLVNKLPQV